MSRTFVAFDLETTGLDPRKDAVIEIAMVRFDAEGNRLGEFSSFVHPGMPVSEEAKSITGITEEDLDGAPEFASIRQEVSEFFGDATVVAHNADFDTSFLVEYGFDFSRSAVIDTFRLAQIAFPEERSMNLSALAEASGYFHEGAHRALSDARATVSVFLECLRRLRDETSTASLACRFLATACPPGSTFPAVTAMAFESAPSAVSAADLFDSVSKSMPEYREAEAPVFPEELPTLAQAFESSGLEARPEQAKMTDAVAAAFERKLHLAIEAPTGIGKTFAYMLPAVIAAARDDKRVVISTNTKTLQDQIEHKDVPRIRSILAPFGLSDFRFAKLKGRTNYASLLRLSEFSQKEAFTEDEALFFAKACVHLVKTRSGELDEFPLYGKQYESLPEIHAGDPRVLSPENPFRKKEPLYRARESIGSADVVLVNHALLLTEIADEGKTIGNVDRIVVDEAHNLESAATDALTRSRSLADIERIFSHIESVIRRHNRTPDAERFPFPELREISDSFVLTYAMAFEFAQRYSDSKSPNGGWARPEYGKGRPTESLVTDDFFSFPGISGMSSVVAAAHEKAKDLAERLKPAPDKLLDALAGPLGELSHSAEFLEEFFAPSRTDLIKTVSVRPGEGAKLELAPLDVSKQLGEKLWARADSVILTSATLAVGDDFSFIKRSLGLEGFEFRILESDFDYSKQAVVFLPTDFGDIRNEAERARVNAFMRDCILASGGRTLGLFTSFASIRESHLQMNADLRKAGIKLLTQGLSGGKHKMIEEFKRDADRSALFGTDSFWEGVDIPGKDLELLFIHKFPFAVPTDPVVMARSKLYRDAFSEYSLPQMLLKLRQGIGRLIRTKEDRGIVVILDSRVRSSWGGAVSGAYPKGIRVREGKSSDFVEMLGARRRAVSEK